LNKSTVFGILSALSEQAYLQEDDATKTYAVGPALLALSESLAKQRSFGIFAKPFLEVLAMTARESAFLTVPSGETTGPGSSLPEAGAKFGAVGE